MIEKGCDNRKRLYWLKKIVIIEKDCNDWKFSSNINQVIRPVLNFFFLLQKDFPSTESSKSIKSTKRHKDTQAKAQKHK